MTRACRQIELSVRTNTEDRPLLEALGILAARGIDVVAHSLYADWNGLVLMVVTENAARARCALEAADFKCETNPVILVEADAQVGAVASLGAQLYRAGVPIQYSHISTANDEVCFAVFKTGDDDRALQALGADALAQAV